MKKKIVYLMMVCLMCQFLSMPVSAANKAWTIELDPGHGGKDSGATAEWFGDAVYEKNLNLKIALYLKEELETYENVTVKMTRIDDTFVSLPYRTKKASKDKANVLVSLHNNASGDVSDYDNGCTVLTAREVYQKKLARSGDELGSQILEELTNVGLENQGILKRISENNSKYPNGELADYYHIVREGIERGYTAIIVEHGFVDHGVDYKEYLRTDDDLKELALADARGIARYYGLHKKGEKPLPKMTNVKEKITTISRNTDIRRKTTYQTFFPEETKEQNSTGSAPTKEGFFETLRSLFNQFCLQK